MNECYNLFTHFQHEPFEAQTIQKMQKLFKDLSANAEVGRFETVSIFSNWKLNFSSHRKRKAHTAIDIEKTEGEWKMAFLVREF